jgi:Asp-tRNA(Asn)/Glu-tRNA(Gln) amidotransferase A subunit family amidase
MPDANSLVMDATRRHLLTLSTAVGLAGTLFPGALLTLASRGMEAQSTDKPDLRGWPVITPEMLDEAAAIAAIKLTAEQKQMMLEGVLSQRNNALRLRELHLPNSVAPTAVFNPVPAGTPAPQPEPPQPVHLAPAPHVVFAAHDVTENPASSEAALDPFAFMTVRELGILLRTRKVTSLALTKMYLARLKRYAPTLHFVITLTEDRALAQAAAMDREVAAGKDRGPLHGIPWGAKDLLAVKGYPTTWGAAGFEQQHFDEDAEVVTRLDAAGAVLVAKLSMGALAQGDLWFGGRTRNPWNAQQGSSGSSAGSASAVSAGCVGFAIGTETLGSISSPSTRCGVTGLRPSFGLVARTGAMALTWSMDKIGPIARSVEDCALVLNAIYGPDGHDQSVQAAPFHADLTLDVRKLRVGYIKSAFDMPVTKPDAKPDLAEAYDAKLAAAALDRLRDMGIALIPVELPDFPFSALLTILRAEGAAAFDELTTSGRDALLTGQKTFDWPNTFRTGRMLLAVDYIQAERARALAMAAMHKTFQAFDVIVAPSGGTQLTATNLCGQPAVIVPNGLRGPDAPPYAPTTDDPWPGYGGPGTPVSLSFLAPLYQDAKAVALAHAYQQQTGFHRLHPKL